MIIGNLALGEMPLGVAADDGAHGEIADSVRAIDQAIANVVYVLEITVVPVVVSAADREYPG